MATARPIVLIESPYAHTHKWGIQLHEAYLEACLFDSLMRGETPIATHKLYTRALDDRIVDERRLGMLQAEIMLDFISIHAVYYDLGISKGMWWGIEQGERAGKRVEPRSLYEHDLHPNDKLKWNDLRSKITMEKTNAAEVKNPD